MFKGEYLVGSLGGLYFPSPSTKRGMEEDNMQLGV